MHLASCLHSTSTLCHSSAHATLVYLLKMRVCMKHAKPVGWESYARMIITFFAKLCFVRFKKIWRRRKSFDWFFWTTLNFKYYNSLYLATCYHAQNTRTMMNLCTVLLSLSFTNCFLCISFFMLHFSMYIVQGKTSGVALCGIVTPWRVYYTICLWLLVKSVKRL